jgi:hypothetical protein
MPPKPRDPNFLRNDVSRHGLRAIDPLSDKAVALEGFPYFLENHSLCRLPERLTPGLPKLLAWVCRHPSGGVLRFATDSRKLVLRVEFETEELCDRTPNHALFGFDAYLGRGPAKRFVKTLYNRKSSLVLEDGIEDLPEGLKEWTLYFPVRNHVSSMRLLVEKGAVLRAPRPYRLTRPVLFYGSSIVEGGCASRAGLTYPAIIGRALDVPIINYGFGGSALGEPEVAKAIAALDMSALVLDYDHNTPSVEHLTATHWPFYRCIRKAHPRLPIVVVSSVTWHNEPAYFGARADVLHNTVRRARAAGDRHISFIHGKTIFPADRWWDCSGDGTHPNDYGFRCMAEVIGGKLEALLFGD